MNFLRTAIQLGLNLFVTRTVSEVPNSAVTAENRDLTEIWRKLHLEFFPEIAELQYYKVSWSLRRQKRTLASCNVERKRILVSAAMSGTDSSRFLEPLLYHEMCHAALGKPVKIRGRRIIHGKEFKALEKRHPEIPSLDLWIKEGGWHRAVRSHNARLRRGRTGTS